MAEVELSHASSLLLSQMPCLVLEGPIMANILAPLQTMTGPEGL